MTMVETDVNGWRCSQTLRDVITSPEAPFMDAVQQTIPNSLTQSSVADINSGSLNSSKDSAASTPDELYIPDAVTEEHCKEEVIKAADDDDDSDDSSITAAPPAAKKKTRGRVKIGFKLIEQKQRRCATFHKRRKGLMKKGFELSVLTGAEVLVMAAWGDSVFSYSTKKLQRVLTSQTGQDLIHRCLTTPADDVTEDKSSMRWNPEGFVERELSIPRPEKRKRMKVIDPMPGFPLTNSGLSTPTSTRPQHVNLAPLSPPNSAKSVNHSPLDQSSFNFSSQDILAMGSTGSLASSVVLNSTNVGSSMSHVYSQDRTPTESSSSSSSCARPSGMQTPNSLAQPQPPQTPNSLPSFTPTASHQQQQQQQHDVNLPPMTHNDQGMGMYLSGGRSFVPNSQIPSTQTAATPYMKPGVVNGMTMYGTYPPTPNRYIYLPTQGGVPGNKAVQMPQLKTQNAMFESLLPPLVQQQQQQPPQPDGAGQISQSPLQRHHHHLSLQSHQATPQQQAAGQPMVLSQTSDVISSAMSIPMAQQQQESRANVDFQAILSL